MIAGGAGRPPEVETLPRLVKHNSNPVQEPQEPQEPEPLSITQSLERLVPSAKTLSVASDELNTLIQALEVRFETLNVGLACWVNFLDSKGAVGYSRFNDKWHLAYRREGEDSLQPLAHAPRYARWRAIKALPELLRQLKFAADAMTERMLTASEEARQLLLQMDAALKEQP